MRGKLQEASQRTSDLIQETDLVVWKQIYSHCEQRAFVIVAWKEYKQWLLSINPFQCSHKFSSGLEGLPINVSSVEMGKAIFTIVACLSWWFATFLVGSKATTSWVSHMQMSCRWSLASTTQGWAWIVNDKGLSSIVNLVCCLTKASIAGCRHHCRRMRYQVAIWSTPWQGRVVDGIRLESWW